jgi:hypothetical protein
MIQTILFRRYLIVPTDRLGRAENGLTELNELGCGFMRGFP